MGPTPPQEDLILIERDPSGVAVVTINRPRSLNSLTRPMMVDLARIFRALDADPSVGAVVIAGRGRAFCSGVDLTAAEEVFKGDVKDTETDLVFQMERCQKPIVGAIDEEVGSTRLERKGKVGIRGEGNEIRPLALDLGFSRMGDSKPPAPGSKMRPRTKRKDTKSASDSSPFPGLKTPNQTRPKVTWVPQHVSRKNSFPNDYTIDGE